MTKEEIRNCRQALGLTMDEFAAKLGFKNKDRRTNISRYESGRIKPHRSVQERLNKLMKRLQTTQ